MTDFATTSTVHVVVNTEGGVGAADWYYRREDVPAEQHGDRLYELTLPAMTPIHVLTENMDAYLGEYDLPEGWSSKPVNALARYHELAERDAARGALMLEASEEAEESADYYDYDELCADLREEAERDLSEALAVLREVLGVEVIEEEVPHGA